MAQAIRPLTALLFFGCCFWTATLLLHIPRHGVKFGIPFLICAVTLALLQYAPLHKVALQQNFQWHRADRRASERVGRPHPLRGLHG